MINKTNNATKDKNTTKYDLVSNKEPNEKIEKGEEDNDINDEAIIPEFETVSMLGASMMSLRKRSTSHQARNLSLKPSNQTENTTNEELNQEKISKLKKFLILYRGSLLALISTFILSIMIILTKKTTLLSSSEIALFRYLVAGIIMLIIAKYKNLPILGPKEFRKTLLMRGFIGVIGMTTYLFALVYVKPSDLVAFSQSSIIMTAILGRIFLKEKLGLIHIVALVITISGVMFISQPTFLFPHKESISYVSQYENNCSRILNAINNNYKNNFTSGFNETLEKECKEKNYKLNKIQNSMSESNYVVGLPIAFVQSLSLSIVQLIIRRLAVKKVHYSVLTLYASILGIPVSIGLSLILIYTGYSKIFLNIKHRFNELMMEIFYTFIISCLGVISQCLIVLSLKYEEAFKVSMIKTVDLFFIFVLQYFWLNIESDMYNIIGVCLIVMSTFIVFGFKYFNDIYLAKQNNNNNNNNNNKNCLKKLIFIQF